MSLYLGDQPIAGISTPVQGRVLGQIIHSLIPLNDAGLHLADGSLIDGTGVYKEFYDYMENLYNNTSTTSYQLYRLGTYSRLGVTISNDFIASNFSSERYLKVPNGRYSTSEFVIKFNTGSDITTYQRVQHCELFCCIELGSSAMSTWDWQNSQNRTILSSISANTDYWIKVTINGNTKTFSTSTDGITYTQRLSYSDTGMDYSASYDFVLGTSSLDFTKPFLGTIDLKEFYVKNTEKNYYIFKFVVPSKGIFIDQQYYDYLYDKYDACGKFVIDTVNKIIRLPYIDTIIQGTLTSDNIGALQEEGLPNITATFDQLGTSKTTTTGAIVTGALYETARNKYLAGGTADNAINGGFSARLSNDKYGNLNGKIQPQTVKAYIYIVIATLTKTDIEVDIDEVVTDLNGKVDKSSLSEVIVVTDSYVSNDTWYMIFSNGWVEQGGLYGGGNGTGYKDISLSVPMADTSFSVIAVRNAETSTTNYNVWAQVPTTTASTTMIRVYVSNAGAVVRWRAYGKKA